MAHKVNKEETKNHPKIKEFMSACQKATNGKTVSINNVQSSDLFKYSSLLMIAEYDKERHDFKFRFCGSTICSYYEMDFTNQYISDAADPNTIDEFIQIYKSIIDNKETVYFTGTLQPRGKEFLNWHQVSQPMMRNGVVNEVLSYVFIEPRMLSSKS